MKTRQWNFRLPFGGFFVVLTVERLLGGAIKFRKNGSWWRVFRIGRTEFRNAHDVSFWERVDQIRKRETLDI